MATYPVDIPSLPPLASGLNDDPAPPIAEDDLLQDNHVTAARAQHTFRKRLFKFNPPLATQDEIVASKRRKHHVESANFVGAAVPMWAHNLQEQIIANMQQQMANMQQQMNQQMANMQQALQQESQQNVQRITRVILQESQRSINRSRNSNAERIERVIRVNDGQIPGPLIWFPLNESSLMDATGAQLSDLLGFYGQDPHGTKVEKQDRLKEFLGVTL